MRGGKRIGAGRKLAENPTVAYSIRVTKSLKEKLDRIGAEKMRKHLTKIVETEDDP